MRLLQSGGIPLWVLPVLLSILFFQIRGVETTADSAWYMVLGLNLYRGLGYLEVDWSPSVSRGPVFPGLLALSYSLFGPSVKSTLWVVRFFFVLNIGLVYAMGARLFNRPVGFIAALLVLTSFVVHQWSSYVSLDNVVPFFILLSQLILFIAFEEKRKLYFGLAGLVLGVAFLTKEIAILFLPLPALLWLFVPSYRPQKTWRGVSIFWGIAVAMVALWFVYAHFAGEGNSLPEIEKHAGLLLSSGNQRDTTSPFILFQWLSDLWLWLANYYQKFLAPNFVLAPLFLVAWGYILLRAIVRRSRPEIFWPVAWRFFYPLFFSKGKLAYEQDRASTFFYCLTCRWLVCCGRSRVTCPSLNFKESSVWLLSYWS